MTDTIWSPEQAASYDPNQFERPSVAVDVAIFALLGNDRPGNSLSADLKVLLVRREHPPFPGMWAIPGGFVRMEESLEGAARRTLGEKTGVREVYLEQLYTFGDVHRDPRTRVISVVYFALVHAAHIQPRPQAEWHSMYALPELAFDHRTILAYGLKRLRYKLEYSAVAFELMPEEFTLRELQEAYMVVLDDHKLDKANFRKKLRSKEGGVESVIESTGKFIKTKGRPAELYRFREDAKVEVKTRRLFP